MVDRSQLAERKRRRPEVLPTLERLAVPRSDFDLALLFYLSLRPRTGCTGKRDGRRAKMVDVFDGEASWPRIRQWRRGKRRPPKWAWDKLKEKTLAKQAEINLAAETLRRAY